MEFEIMKYKTFEKGIKNLLFKSPDS